MLDKLKCIRSRQWPVAMAALLLAVTLGIVSAQPAQAQTTCHVDANASLGGNGQSWATAYKYLQDALYNDCNEIKVAQGAYYPDDTESPVARQSQATALLSGSPYSSFYLDPGTSILGGYDSSTGNRNWKTNVTVLSGDVDQDDKNVDAHGIIYSTGDIVGINSHTVVHISGSGPFNASNNAASGPSEGAIVDGVTITAGHNNDDDDDGARNMAASSASSRNGGNGGGMFISSGFDGCTNATADGLAADGLAVDGGTMLTNVSFVANHAENGGGLYVSGSNHCDVSAAKGFADGQGPMLTNVLFMANSAQNNGGGIYSEKGSTIMLTNVTASANSASDGSGIYNDNGTIMLTNSILWGNQGGEGPNQIYNDDSSSSQISYSLIQGSGGSGDGNWAGNSVGQDLGNNIDEDPNFVTANDLRLQSGSPAINHGDNSANSTSSDLAGNPRILDVTIDMGAYEFLNIADDNDDDGDGVPFIDDTCPTSGPALGIVSDRDSLCPEAEAPTVRAFGMMPMTVITNMHGLSSIDIPVAFADGGASVATLGFTLDYDESCISYSAIADGDSMAAQHIASVTNDVPNGSMQVAVSLPGNSPPLPLLSNGDVVILTFDVLPACVTDNGAPSMLSFTISNFSFGDDQGQAVGGGTTVVDDYSLRFNANPTDITLDNSSVNENLEDGTVGTLDSTDIDEDTLAVPPYPGDSHTYALAATGCASSADNGNFVIDGDTLKTSTALDFETQASYNVCIQSTDSYGGIFTDTVAVSLTDLNEAPTAIALSGSSVAENQAAGASVGTLSSTDQDVTYDGDASPPATNITEVLVHTLPGGVVDNADFAIVGNALQTAAMFDHETKDTYTVRVRSTDDAGESIERDFDITVTNVNDAPKAVDDPDSPPLIVLGDGNRITIDVLANDSDEDGDSISISAIDTAGTNGSVTNTTSDVSYLAVQNTNGADSFGYTISDGSTLGPLTDDATVNLYVVADDERGDCNSDGNVNAADFAAIVLEIFDTDTDTNWWTIAEMGAPDFQGSPRGCDANASLEIGSADIICTVLLFFGNTCAEDAVAAAGTRAAATATLLAPQALEANAGTSIDIDISLDTGGNDVASATFALELDPAAVSFDDSDANGDGLPDAVSINAPASMTKSVSWNAEQNRLEVALFGLSLPLPTLSDGKLATISLDVAANAFNGHSPLTLELVSMGSPDGANVDVNDQDGSLTISGGVERQTVDSGNIFLPIVTK